MRSCIFLRELLLEVAFILVSLSLSVLRARLAFSSSNVGSSVSVGFLISDTVADLNLALNRRVIDLA